MEMWLACRAESGDSSADITIIAIIWNEDYAKDIFYPEIVYHSKTMTETIGLFFLHGMSFTMVRGPGVLGCGDATKIGKESTAVPTIFSTC